MSLTASCPLRARSAGQRRVLTVTCGQPDYPADLRTGRLTRCAHRPFKQRVTGSVEESCGDQRYPTADLVDLLALRENRHMSSCVELLRGAFAESNEALGRVLADIGDDEFFWEPVANCWTVHPRSEVRAASADGCGQWVIDYEVPDPDPAPVTTIAWRTVHIAAVNYLYWDYGFGPATASFDLEMPGNAAAATRWLAASQVPLNTVLAELADADLDTLRKTNWGEWWPCHKIFTTLVREQVHHGAEISLLRDLYRNRETLGSQDHG